MPTSIALMKHVPLIIVRLLLTTGLVGVNSTTQTTVTTPNSSKSHQNASPSATYTLLTISPFNSTNNSFQLPPIFKVINKYFLELQNFCHSKVISKQLVWLMIRQLRRRVRIYMHPSFYSPHMKKAWVVYEWAVLRQSDLWTLTSFGNGVWPFGNPV